jgi:hypothetical protein
MDSVLGWLCITVLAICSAVWFVRYTIAEYDRYIYNRSHGWQ